MFGGLHTIRTSPHVLSPRVLQLFEDETAFFVVTELCRGGDLRQELMNSGLYSEKRAALLMQQVLGCVEYFHSKNIVHRDIKPGSELLSILKNVLLQSCSLNLTNMKTSF